MVNIAFPAMAATFGVSAPAMRWVIVCYVLSYAFLSFAGGALGDRIGYRPVFVVGMAGSAVAYVVAAAAPTFGWLLAGRVMQGLAGGDRKSTRLNSSHVSISYAVFCLKKK